MATRAKTTTLDEDTTKPSVTEPGDGPADTTDPSETATSVTPQPGPEAIAAGTVNAVVPTTPEPKPEPPESEHRIEFYDAVAPNGSTVRVKRDMETGKTELVEAETPAETPPTPPAE